MSKSVVLLNRVIDSQFVFTDLKNRIIHVTSDHGRTFEHRPVQFVPGEIAFHEYLPLVFAVLDKEDPNKSVSNPDRSR